MGEVIDLQERRRDWLVVREKCRACFFTAIGVVMQGSNLDAQECGNCHAFSSAVTHFLKHQEADALAEYERIVHEGHEPEWSPRLTVM